MAHAKELRNPVPTAPFFFLKPTSAFLAYDKRPNQPNEIRVPSYGKDLHHEVEMCVVMGDVASRVRAEDALDLVAGYAIGLDMTLRDVQAEKKKKGLPWTEAKAFDTSLALGSFIPKTDVPDPNDLDVWLTVDGETRQHGNTRDMIFDVPKLIEAASKVMTLFPGDVLCTGTPEGVGPVEPGQIMRAGIRGFEDHEIIFTSRRYE